MSAFSERIIQDIRKIEELSNTVAGRVKIKSKSGNPVNNIVLEIAFPTAPSSNYPQQVQDKTEVRIELLSNYPFKEPLATITTPIYHPNVYGSGKICFGTKWMPSHGLDLLVKRIIQIITFDESILNEKSPANTTALSWYRGAVRKHRHAFPTDKLVIKEEPKKKMAWNNIEKSSSDRSVVSCPACNGSLRVPVGRKGNLACPMCAHKFYIET